MERPPASTGCTGQFVSTPRKEKNERASINARIRGSASVRRAQPAVPRGTGSIAAYHTRLALHEIGSHPDVLDLYAPHLDRLRSRLAPDDARHGILDRIVTQPPMSDPLDARDQKMAVIAVEHPFAMPQLRGVHGRAVPDVVEDSVRFFTHYIADRPITDSTLFVDISARIQRCALVADHTLKLTRMVVEDYDVATVFHELGHWLEAQSPGLYEESHAFLMRRATGVISIPTSSDGVNQRTRRNQCRNSSATSGARSKAVSSSYSGRFCGINTTSRNF